MTSSSCNKYSALRVNRLLFDPDAVESQQMPESSEPRLDWSKLGDELDVAVAVSDEATTATMVGF